MLASISFQSPSCGLTTGTVYGRGVGDRVGDAVGYSVGTVVGLAVGNAVGMAEQPDSPALPAVQEPAGQSSQTSYDSESWNLPLGQ